MSGDEDMREDESKYVHTCTCICLCVCVYVECKCGKCVRENSSKPEMKQCITIV